MLLYSVGLFKGNNDWAKPVPSRRSGAAWLAMLLTLTGFGLIASVDVLRVLRSPRLLLLTPRQCLGFGGALMPLAGLRSPCRSGGNGG